MTNDEKLNFLKKLNFECFPLKGKTKAPLKEGWQQKREYTPEEQGDNNIGIITGPESDLLVLDIDNPQLVASFCRRYHYEIRKDFMVKTGKGYHVYYKYPKDGKEYRCKAYPIFGFDIRAVGGYVVGPYSLHEDTGQYYEIVNNGEIPMAPEQLPKYCFNVKRSPVPKIDEISENIRDFIKNGTGKGYRSEAIMSVLNSLVATGLDDDQIFYIFNTYKIGEKYFEKPAEIRDQWLQDQIDKAREFVKSEQTVPDTIDNNDEDDLVITYKNGQEILESDVKMTWLLEDILDQGGHTIITGRSNVGKSCFTLNLAFALSQGSKNGFLGHTIPRPLKVVVIQCENPERGMKERFKKLIKQNPQYKDIVGSIEFVYFNGRHNNPLFKLTYRHLEKKIDQIYADKKPDIIILDPYKSYSGVEENSNDRNRDVLDNFFYILEKHGITAIIVHHEGKSNELTGMARSRGASAIIDTVDNHWSIDRKKDKDTGVERLKLSCQKARNIKIFDDIYLEIIDDIYFKHVVEPYDPKILSDIIAGNDGTVDTQTAFIAMIIERMEVSTKKARDLIDVAVQNKYIVSESYGQNRIRYKLPQPNIL